MEIYLDTGVLTSVRKKSATTGWLLVRWLRDKRPLSAQNKAISGTRSWVETVPIRWPMIQ